METVLQELRDWAEANLAQVQGGPDEIAISQFVAEVGYMQEKARRLHYDCALLWPEVGRLVTIAFNLGLVKKKQHGKRWPEN